MTGTHPRPDRLDLRSARPPRDIRGRPSSPLTFLLRSATPKRVEAWVRGVISSIISVSGNWRLDLSLRL
jgi:hypothetical protein